MKIIKLNESNSLNESCKFFQITGKLFDNRDIVWAQNARSAINKYLKAYGLSPDCTNEYRAEPVSSPCFDELDTRLVNKQDRVYRRTANNMAQKVLKAAGIDVESVLVHHKDGKQYNNEITNYFAIDNTDDMGNLLNQLIHTYGPSKHISPIIGYTFKKDAKGNIKVEKNTVQIIIKSDGEDMLVLM